MMAASKEKGNSNHGLRRFYERFTNDIDLTRGVLDYLISLCVMTTDDREEVNKEPTPSGRNRIILDILIDRPYETCHLFADALRMGDQDCNDLINYLDFTKEVTDELDDRFSNLSVADDNILDHTVKLYKNFQKFVNRIGAIDNVCDSLVSKDVLNLDDVKDIETGTNESDRNRCLLSKLIRNSLSKYDRFIQALREDSILCELAAEIEQTPVTGNDLKLLKIGYLKTKERQEYRIIKEKEWLDRLKAVELQMAETIPKHRLAQFRIRLDEWRKEKDTFVTTSAAKRVLELIRENNCVTVTGNSGVGKTAAVRHAAMELLQEGYIVVPVSTPEDIVNFYNPERMTLFVIDDLCGRYTLNQSYLDVWKLRLDEIKSLMNSDHCKVIATCRLQVFKDERFKDLSIFSTCECNLSSKELSLSAEEKSRLINAYCGGHASDISDEFKSEFFPLLCRLYKNSKDTDIRIFFEKPFEIYDREMEHLLRGDDTAKYKYCCLVLVVIFNNRLKEDILSGKIDSKVMKIIEDILPECKLNIGTSPKCLLESLKTLEGTFLVHEDGCYRTIHDKLFDYLSHYFGNQMIHILIDHTDSQFNRERFVWKTSGQTKDTDFTINIPDEYIDDYVNRVIKDWADGKVVDVFSNRNMKSKEFSMKLLDHLNQLDKSKQSELANMKVDNRWKETTLTKSCFNGDVNLTRWLINHGVSVNHCRNNSVSPLHIACHNGYIDTVRELIKCGSDLQKCDNDGASHLFIACKNGHIDTVRELIKSGSDLHKCVNNGASPLYAACYNGHIDTVRELIKCGSDLQKCTNNGASPLYIACKNGHIDTVRELIKCGSDLQKCTNNGASPLYTACENGHIDTVRELIKCGSDLQKSDNDGASPLFIACKNGHIDTVRELIKCGSDLQKCDNDGASPLYIACQNGHIDTVRELIKCGSDLQKCDNDGASPLYTACENGHIDTVRELIKCGSDLQKSDNDGASPLYTACENGHIDTVRELIKCGSDLQKCDNDGASPLYIACQNGHIDTVRELIKCGSDLQKCDNDGASPLYIACQNGHIDTVRELIKCGSDLQKSDNDGASPLYTACENGHIDTVRELIKCGSDLQKCDNDGASPLYIACQNGHIDTVRELIKCGSDLQKCDNGGASPLFVACHNGHLNVVNLLLELSNQSGVNTSMHIGVSPLWLATVTNNYHIVQKLLDNAADIDKCVHYKDKFDGAVLKYHSESVDSYMELFMEIILKHTSTNVYSYIQESLGNQVLDLVVSSSPLHMACFMGHVDIVKLILDRNPNINIAKEDGRTPLYLACEYGHAGIVKLLIEKGADDKVCRNDGKSPFNIASENGHRDVISLLTGKGKESNL